MSNSSRRLSQASTLANPEILPDPKQDLPSLTNACRHGDLNVLKSIDTTIITADILNKLFDAATSHGQAEVIQHLSSRFHSHPLSYNTTSIAFRRGDAATLRALLTHDPSIANSKDNHSTKLNDFCSGIDPTMALLLLEFGADPNVYPPEIFMLNPLNAAVKEQPMVLIERLVERGAGVTDFTVASARIGGREDVVRYLEAVRKGKEGKGQRCLVL